MGYYGRGVLAESDKLARVHGHFRHARGDFGKEMTIGEREGGCRGLCHKKVCAFEMLYKDKT